MPARFNKPPENIVSGEQPESRKSRVHCPRSRGSPQPAQRRRSAGKGGVACFSSIARLRLGLFWLLRDDL